MKVLLTKKLAPSHIQLLKSWGWSFDSVPALTIVTAPVLSIPEESEAWVVSSRNSWPAIKKFIDKAPQNVYCIGKWFERELLSAGVQSQIRTFDTMHSLVQELRSKHLKSITYFCGDVHREELDSGLAGTPTVISKVITHNSSATNPVIKKVYDAIFVFSPASAESLLSKNQFSTETVFGCIGPTTASYLNEKGFTQTFCASTPDSEVLLREFHKKFAGT